jgi:hypothetical protein
LWALALALVAATSLVVPAPVAGAALLRLDPASGPRGTTVDAIGSGFPADCELSVQWDGVEIRSATSLATPFVIEFRVPSDATLGRHTVTMATTGAVPEGCASIRDEAVFAVVLHATPTPSPTPTPEPAPATGEAPAPLNPLPLAIGAAVLLVGGAGLLAVRRRRMAAAARRAAEPGAWRRRLPQGDLTKVRR